MSDASSSSLAQPPPSGTIAAPVPKPAIAVAGVVAGGGANALTDARLVVLPHSYGAILAVLSRGPATARTLRDGTGLPRRTIYSGLVKLKQLGIVAERPYLRDMRQALYTMRGDAPGFAVKPKGGLRP